MASVHFFFLKKSLHPTTYYIVGSVTTLPDWRPVGPDEAALLTQVGHPNPVTPGLTQRGQVGCNTWPQVR